VQPFRIDGEADAFVRLQPHAGIDASDHRRTTGAEVEQDLVAERLDYVDLRREAVLIRSVGDAQGFGADAERQPLAAVRADAIRNVQTQALGFGVPAIA